MSAEKKLPLEIKFRRAARTVLSYDDKYVDAVLKNPEMRNIPEDHFDDFREVLTRERAKRQRAQRIIDRVQAQPERRSALG